MLSRLTLAMSAASGMSVVTMTQCHGEATTQVEAKIARHGPKGTAARLSADPSDELKLTVTFTISGTCRAVSSINLKRGGSRTREKAPCLRAQKG